MKQRSIKIIKVSDASFLAEELFQHSFAQSPPDFPIHYIALDHVGPQTFKVVGYYHITYCDAYVLAGGLCVDEEYRDKKLGRALASIAFEDAGEAKAFFTYTGNPVSRSIVYRLGYVDTPHQYLMVKWMTALSKEEQEQLIAEVAKLEPF